jgi:ribosomal protein S18 acetylase RimI-like enzyme
MPASRPTESADLLIREARTTDFPAIAGLVTDPDELFRAFPAGNWPLTVRQLHRLAEQRLNLTVGCMEDSVVAFANLYGLQPGNWIFIGNVIVQEGNRCNGTGRTLLLHMLDLVYTSHALPEARISVFSDNIPALRLYSSLGFREFSRETRTGPGDRPVVLLHLKHRRPGQVSPATADSGPATG